MNSGRRLVIVGAAVLAAGLFGGCTRDRGAARFAGPAEALREGGRVSGIRRDSISIVGSSWQSSAKEAPFSADVVGGSALDDSSGLVATSRVLGAAHKSHRFADKQGRGNQIDLDADGPNSPVRRATWSVDGRAAIVVDYDWQSRGPGWTLKHRRTTLLSADGRPTVRLDRSLDRQDVAAASFDRRAAEAAVAALLTLSPRVAQAQLWSCIGYDIQVAIWGGVAVLAGIAFGAAPSSITLAAVGAAISAFDKALDAFIGCMETNAGMMM